MAGFLPPVVVTLVADTAEFQAAIDEASASMGELGAASETTAAKVDTSSTAIASKAGGAGTYVTGGFKKLTTAVIGAGVGFAAFGLDKAVKLQEALDNVANQTNTTTGELVTIRKESIALSDQTGQSAVDIVGAFGAARAAGYGMAASYSAASAAAKLAVISQQPVLTTTQAIIAAQKLGVTQGMSSAKVADLLTVGLKGNEQGLTGVLGLLQGKVGAGFAAYKQSAGEAVSIANTLSEAQYSNTRAVSTFINKLGALQGPMNTTSTSNGKLTTTSASYVNALKDVGLNVGKTKDAFTGPDGLVNGLKYLDTVADGSLPKLHNYLTAIFGATGVGLGSLLIKNLGQITSTTNAANAASPAGLTTAFTTAAQQFGNQLKIVWANFENDAAGFGETLMPGLEKVLGFFERGFQGLEAHPDEEKALFADLGATFAAAIGVKLVGAFKNLTQGTAQIGLLQQIATNTSITADATTTGDAEGGAIGGASVIGKFGSAVGIFAAGVVAFEGVTKLLHTNLGTKIADSVLGIDQDERFDYLLRLKQDNAGGDITRDKRILKDQKKARTNVVLTLKAHA